jgi:two-component system, chemotaxis family, protein-glutamate methylesterase/glutaminase
MPTTDRSAEKRIRTIVTAPTPLAAMQLARDLSANAALQISFATSETSLWQEIDANRPQVVLLDTRIAGNNAPHLVNDLIRRAKLPVLIRTEIRENSPQMLLDCIAAGALGILDKPTSVHQIAEAISELIWSIKAASNATMEKLESLRSANWSLATGGETGGIFAIGAGLGGTIALENLLMQLPQGAPGTVAVTALPQQLLSIWADRLDKRCNVRVKPARDGDGVRPGQVLIAPGESHLLLRRNNSDWTVKIKDGPAVFHQKPSAEMLFGSLADTGAPQAVGVLLGGAGVDGIAGLLQLRKAGARTLVESQSTSILADLPTRAFHCGAAEAQIPANELAAKMLELATTQRIPRAA